MTKSEGQNPKVRRRARAAPSVPFKPFHPVALTPEEVAEALRGQRETPLLRAVMLILEGLDCCAIDEMVTDLPMGQGGHSYLKEAMLKIRQLVEAKPLE